MKRKAINRSLHHVFASNGGYKFWELRVVGGLLLYIKESLGVVQRYKLQVNGS
jgi:hypothetical protein